MWDVQPKLSIALVSDISDVLFFIVDLKGDIAIEGLVVVDDVVASGVLHRVVGDLAKLSGLEGSSWGTQNINAISGEEDILLIGPPEDVIRAKEVHIDVVNEVLKILLLIIDKMVSDCFTRICEDSSWWLVI